MTTSAVPPISQDSSPLLSRSQLAFLLTLALYILAAGAVFITLKNTQNSHNNAPQLRQVPMSAKMFNVTPPQPKVEPKKVEPKVEPKVTPQPKIIHPIKPAPKPIQKPKPVIKKKAIPKHEPEKVVKKEVKPKVTPPVVKPKPVEKEMVKQEVVKKTIEQPVVKTPTVTKPVTPTQPTAEQRAAQASAEKNYTSELQQALYRYAQNTYPFMAKRRHWEGKVEVTFTLHKDGSITNVHVTNPDMRDIFNDAAMSIFTDEMKMHFKPFPKAILRDTWTLSVPISYNLR